MPLNVSQIRALCFDVDGTLSDTDDIYAQKFERFFRPLRPLLPQKDPALAARRFVMWAETPGNLLMSLSDQWGLDSTLSRAAEWLNRANPRPLRHFLLIPGVEEMLERLAPHYPMAVVSARDEVSTRAFLAHFGLTRFFPVIITALSAPHTKPYPDPVRLAAAQMGVAASHCLMIGDTTVDIRAGKSAGAQTVGVLCGFGERPELEKANADALLETTAQLPSLLGLDGAGYSQM